MNGELANDRGMHYYHDDSYRNSSASHSAPSYSSGYNNPEAGYQIKEHKKSSSSRSWDFRNDPEMKRKKRVASYKVFTVEGKVKSSVRNSFRWIKNKYLEMRYGWF
ncbi:uncharacterized protein LOC9656307 [Selaginella moellendorffii]|nr:uncharacterized protein LOC9656307 [Selaginella moellendorffii]|eukprot:XP_002980551.2 uncharacterized protein LOC9656307 [Selaginella moellendorffii]